MTALAGAGQPARQKRMFAVRSTRQFVNSMAVAVLGLGLGLAFLVGASWGQDMGNYIMSPAPNVRPPGLKNVGIQQNLNRQIPPDLIFTDDLGHKVKLGDYFGQKPLILNFVYYGCPMLCGEELSGLESALRVLKFDVGKEFEVITISFDPKNTPETAAKKKEQFLRRYNRPGAERGWHFLVGEPSAIDAVTKAAGFQYEYDPKTGEFAHSTAILVLTPQGNIAQYYYGIEYSPKDLRLALVEASENRIGNVVDELLLYCYHYDPEKGTYSATVMRVLRLMAVATMLCLGALLFVMIRRSPDDFHRAEQVR